MALDTSNNNPINDKNDLIDYLASGCKPKDQWRIGTEHEKFVFYKDNYNPVPYEGSRGIKALLEGMENMLGWQPIIDENKLIGLVEPTGFGAISLEPGGQFELSGAAVKTLHQTCREVHAHLAQLREISTPLGIGFLGVGGSPKWKIKDVPIMPKSRYKIMTEYMPQVGHHGLDMMYRTATIQVNLDFSSESDMRKKMQIGMKLQSVATAIFATSPFTEGTPNGFLSWRSEIWRDTDNMRSGILPFVFKSDFSFNDYVEWALDIPMYFVLRDHHYHKATDITFRQFMNGAFKGRIKDYKANIGDFINHLSTLFPEVRLKKFLEMRGADGGPWRRICALPAFWVGLLYDSEALAMAEDFTKDWQFSEVLQMRNNVPRYGLKTPFRQTNLLDLAKKCLAISEYGLKNRNLKNQQNVDERQFLSPIREILQRGTTDAEEMLKKYQTSWKNNIDPIFSEYAY